MHDRPISTQEWIAFDLETTGLFTPSDRVVEIAAVRFDAAGRELARFDRLINPERPMSAGAQAVHGLSDADLAGAPTAREVLPAFLEFLGDPGAVSLLAHNAEFDCRFLGHEIARAGLPRPLHAVVDTLALARRRRPDLPDHRLESLARVYRLDGDNPHRALADSRRVMRLWLALDGPGLPASHHMRYPVLDTSRLWTVPIGWEAVAGAIAEGWRLRIEYTGGRRGDAPREITPRAFVQRGGTPYLVAYCHIDAYEKSFRLDRVRRFEVVRGPA